MRTIFNHKKGLAPWSLLLFFALMLFIMGKIMVSSNWQERVEEAKAQGESYLAFLEFELSMHLQDRDYEAIRELMSRWGKEHTVNIAELKLVAENGYLLGHYTRPQHAGKTFILTSDIEYSYKNSATLTLLCDLSSAEKSSRRYLFQVSLAGLFILLFFAYVLRQTQRSRHEAEELDRTNVRLQEEIVHRNETERALRKSKEDWEKTFDAISDVVVLQDSDLRTVRINRAGCALLGATEEELVGKHCYEIFHGTSVPCRDCPAQESVKGSKSCIKETHIPRLQKTFLTSTSPIFTDQGDLKGFIYLAKDITELKSLQSQLRQSQKMEAIGALAGGIAHDFNNILSAVLGYTDLAHLEAPEGSAIQQKLAAIREAGNRARDLVRQILQFSRQTSTEKKALNIATIVREALKLIRASLPSCIELRHNIPSRSPQIIADPTQIHQIVMNLCTNAYHAIGDNDGLLSIDLTEVDVVEEKEAHVGSLHVVKYLRLSVNDSGHGMKPETLEHIFDSFFTTKKNETGTGMGLSLIKGIVQESNGALTVSSAPEVGTTFDVYFPCAGGEPGTLEEQSVIPELPTGKGRILLIDDDHTLVELGREMLSSLGYEVTATSKCVEAGTLFADNPDAFDLVITDQMMPRIKGSELAREFLAIRPDIPIILYTGLSTSLSDKEAGEIGIRAVLRKPLSIYHLANEINKILASDQ